MLAWKRTVRCTTNDYNPLIPEAIPLQPEVVRARGTSRSDWPPAVRCRDSTRCPCWWRRRSGRRGAGRTAGPAGLSTGHLKRRRARERALTFTFGGTVEGEVSGGDLTYARAVAHSPTWELLKLHRRIALLAAKALRVSPGATRRG